MESLIGNLTSIHLIAWIFFGISGLLVGGFLSRRDVTMGIITLIFAVLAWTVFIGLIPLLNHALGPDGLGGVFAGRGFGKFLEDAAPQAIFQEPVAHRIEVLLSAGIGAVLFSVCGFVLAVTMRGRESG